jgi:hypothetical protein
VGNFLRHSKTKGFSRRRWKEVVVELGTIPALAWKDGRKSQKSSQSMDQGPNTGPPEYKAEALTITLLRQHLICLKI